MNTQDFLKLTGTKISICWIDTRLHSFFVKEEPTYRNVWKVRIKNKHGSFSCRFYTHHSNVEVTPYDVLACLSKDEKYTDLFEFAATYGDTIDDKKTFNDVNRIMKAVNRESAAMRRLFPEPEYFQALLEIQ
jgi:hypothetical protein